MPNHVKNIVKMTGITALPVFTEKKDHDGTVIMGLDFEKIIPMPESLRVVAGTMENVAIEAVIRKAAMEIKHSIMSPRLIPGMTDSEYKQSLKRSGKSENELCVLGLQYINNLVLHGATTWYDWCIKHWGTKWNAYENEQINSDTITFETAWSAPEPIIAQLAKMYPDIEIEHWWADEDMGSNTGYAKYVGGEQSEVVYHDTCSNNAYETYILCWGESKCLVKDENGSWKHKSCDQCGDCGE